MADNRRQTPKHKTRTLAQKWPETTIKIDYDHLGPEPNFQVGAEPNLQNPFVQNLTSQDTYVCRRVGGRDASCTFPGWGAGRAPVEQRDAFHFALTKLVVSIFSEVPITDAGLSAWLPIMMHPSKLAPLFCTCSEICEIEILPFRHSFFFLSSSSSSHTGNTIK